MVEAINPRQQKLANSISEIVMIVSFAMLFATLMLGYTMYRLTSESWPPMGLQRVDLLIPAFSTVILVMSSFTLSSFNNDRLKNLKSAKLALWSTIVLGTAFGISQWFLWQDLEAVGLVASEGIFQSILYGFTWIHAAHVILGWLGLLLLIPTVGNKEVKVLTRVGLISKFWHFLDIVWIIMFLAIFVF
jgi:cytochrome c oxidase subunit 3